jgi:hypothetical protein
MNDRLTEERRRRRDDESVGAAKAPFWGGKSRGKVDDK